MALTQWERAAVWLLLSQAGLLGCSAYTSRSNRFSRTRASSSRGSANTYNFYMQPITSPNATLFCGLFSISYETWCKFGSVDAYITDETAVSGGIV